MPDQYILQQTPQIPSDPQQKQLPRMYFFIGAALFSLLLLGIGLLLGANLNKGQDTQTPLPTPTATPVPLSQTAPTPSAVSEIPQVQFLPGKQYFDDTYVAVEQAAPHKTLILSVSRIEQTRGFAEYTKLNYFDGNTWDRKTLTTTISSSEVSTNPLLREWNEPQAFTTSNPKPLAVVQIPTGTLSFTSTDLSNETSIQSLPGSTKFIYQGLGSIQSGGDEYPAYIFRSRTYSFNAADLGYLASPETSSLSWFLFWDEEGSFSYIDRHRPQTPTSEAQSLSIGVQEDSSGKVIRTNEFTMTEERKSTSQLIKVTYAQPFNTIINLPVMNVVMKSPSKNYTWELGLARGEHITKEGRKIPGVGLFEIIKQNN